MRTIHLPALSRSVSLGAYVKAIRAAQAYPADTFTTGLTTWWPTTGAEVMRQFRDGMTDRINQGISYSKRGQ